MTTEASYPSLTWEAFGHRIELSWDLPQHRQIIESCRLPNWQMRGVLGGGAHAQGGAASASRIDLRGTAIYDNGSFWTQVPQLEDLTLLLKQLLQSHLTWGAVGYTFLHAGVVSLKGQAWLNPGASKCGKSQWVLAMLEAGASYYSDELAVIDAQGLVHSYPRPLWRRSSRTRREAVSAEQLGWSPQLQPIPIAHCILTHYQKGVSWRGQTISPDQACQLLAPWLRCHPDQIGQASQRLRTALQEAHCCQGPRGEAQDWLLDYQRSFSLPS